MTLLPDLDASTDITIITQHTEITDASGTVVYYADDIYHFPFLWILFVGSLMLILFRFIYWQIQHRLENKMKK